jgi:hypothetical protein
MEKGAPAMPLNMHDTDNNGESLHITQHVINHFTSMAGNHRWSYVLVPHGKNLWEILQDEYHNLGWMVNPYFDTDDTEPDGKIVAIQMEPIARRAGIGQGALADFIRRKGCRFMQSSEWGAEIDSRGYFKHPVHRYRTSPQLPDTSQGSSTGNRRENVCEQFQQVVDRIASLQDCANRLRAEGWQPPPHYGKGKHARKRWLEEVRNLAPPPPPTGEYPSGLEDGGFLSL